MKNTILTAAVMWLLIVLSGCEKSPATEGLGRAEAVMNENPDSAYRILSGVEGQLSTASDTALYAVLYTQARSKLNYCDSNDSLINHAVRYYAGRNDRHAMLAMFYKADVLYWAARYAEALEYNLRALELATQLGDRYWQARAHEAMADCYHECYNMEGVKHHLLPAIDNFYATGHDLNGHYARCAYIAAEVQSGYYRRAVEQLDSMRATGTVRDSVCHGLLLQHYMRPLEALGRADEALEYHRQSLEWLTPANYDLINWPDIAILLVEAGRADSAARLLESCTLPPVAQADANRHRGWYRYYENTGDSARALEELKLSLAGISGGSRSANLNNFKLVEQTYYEQSAMRERIRRERAYWIAVTAMLVCAVCVLGGILLYRVQTARREEMYSQRLAEVSDIVNNDSTQRYLLERLSALVEVSQECVEARKSDEKFERALSRFTKEVQKMTSENAWDLMVQTINTRHDGIYDRFRADFRDMDDEYVRLFVLSAYGLKPRTIAAVFGYRTSNVYNRMSRMRRRIEDAGEAAARYLPFIKYHNAE